MCKRRPRRRRAPLPLAANATQRASPFLSRATAPSFLELQSERRETTELGYPGRCPRQPQKHRPGSGPPVARSLVYGPGPGSGPPVARSLVYGPGPGSSWEIGLHYRPHTWAPLGPRQGFFSAFDSFTIGTPVSNLKLGR